MGGCGLLGFSTLLLLAIVARPHPSFYKFTVLVVQLFGISGCDKHASDESVSCIDLSIVRALPEQLVVQSQQLLFLLMDEVSQHFAA